MSNVTIETIHAVQVEDRDDGLYLFRQSADAERFAQAVRAAGGSAQASEEPINHAPTARELIGQELQDMVVRYKGDKWSVWSHNWPDLNIERNGVRDTVHINRVEVIR